MLPIYADWLVVAALAAAIGFRKHKSRLTMVMTVGVIGFVGWAATFPLVIIGTNVGGDTGAAEDYINGLNIWTGVTDFAVWIGWTLLWLAFGLVGGILSRRLRTLI